MVMYTITMNIIVYSDSKPFQARAISYNVLVKYQAKTRGPDPSWGSIVTLIIAAS